MSTPSLGADAIDLSMKERIEAAPDPRGLPSIYAGEKDQRSRLRDFGRVLRDNIMSPRGPDFFHAHAVDEDMKSRRARNHEPGARPRKLKPTSG